MTKGIILSGGWGTRLRPLTCTMPKTLIPVVNKPVIERQILLLKAAGVKEIVLAVSVMSEDLKKYFDDGDKLGVKIDYTNEKSPMGTAGAIKLGEEYLKDENFFMLNGDVILNYDFKKMLDSHEKNKGIGTIASRIVNDPERYGVLYIEEGTEKILAFREKSEYKPPKEGPVSMPVNAGVYILEPEIFTHIEPNKKVSIEHDVFPSLAEEGKLFHHPISGIWKDIGRPDELLEGNILLLTDLLKNNNQENLIDEKAKFDGKFLIYPPVAIGENAVIRNNCIIGPNVIIGDNVYLGENSQIKEALIYDNTYISKNCKIERSIVSDNCLLHDNAVLQGNEKSIVILASYVHVEDHVRLVSSEYMNLTVCHHEIVKDSKSF